MARSLARLRSIGERTADKAARRPVRFAPSARALTPLFTLALLLAAGRALGQADDEVKRAATAHLARGAALVEADDLQGALKEFDEAYRLVPSPNIMHNFGIVYQGLGRPAEAAESFERFLAEAPNAPPEARSHASRVLPALMRQVAAMTVVADVPGAEIFVDGRKHGATPRERPVYLDPGPHHISVEQPGSGRLYSERREVTAGQRFTLQARLLPLEPPTLAALPASAGPSLAITAPPVTPAAAAPVSSRRWQLPLAWGTAVVATAGLGYALIQGLAYNSLMTGFNEDGCGKDDVDLGGGTCRVRYQDAQSARDRAIVGGAAAGALAIAAAVLFATLPDRPTGVGLSFACSATAARLGCQGHF